MNYVEWLRVRHCLRVVAIVLGVMLVLGLCARLWVAVEFHNDQSVIDRVGMDRGTITTHTTYDGRPRTILVNPREHVRVTIDDRADGGRTVTVVQPKSVNIDDSDNADIGSVKITTSSGPVNRTTIIDTDSAVPVDFYLGFAYIMALIVATVLGGSFARENDGHLEYALLKPVSRERYALGVIAADFSGILASMVLTIVALLIGQAFFELPRVDFSGDQWWFVATVIVVPLAWWAVLNAASTSLKRGAGAVIGFSWPVSIVIVVLALSDLGTTSLGRAIHAVAWGLSRLIPITYGVYSTGSGGETLIHSTNVFAALVLLIVYGALIVVQWRRVEA
jgi:hypothetical protein